jgi:hypothetical protein
MKFIIIILGLVLFGQENSFAKLIPDSKFNPRVPTPTFISEHPNLCFDQGHLNLGPGDGRHDPVLKLLESDGYQITILKSAFDEKTLEACRVLYISSTMAASEDQSGFTTQEIEIVKTWVERGGGLLLMTDHPKMLAIAPEKLANAFGVFGSIKTVEDSKRTVTGLNDPTVIYFSEKEMNKKT